MKMRSSVVVMLGMVVPAGATDPGRRLRIVSGRRVKPSSPAPRRRYGRRLFLT